MIIAVPSGINLGYIEQLKSAMKGYKSYISGLNDLPPDPIAGALCKAEGTGGCSRKVSFLEDKYLSEYWSTDVQLEVSHHRVEHWQRCQNMKSDGFIIVGWRECLVKFSPQSIHIRGVAQEVINNVR